MDYVEDRERTCRMTAFKVPMGEQVPKFVRKMSEVQLNKNRHIKKPLNFEKVFLTFLAQFSIEHERIFFPTVLLFFSQFQGVS